MKRVLLRTALIAGACVSAATPAAEPVGRLFFTPAQRSALDAGKRIGEPRAGPVAPQGPRELTLDGVVTRSDGESTIWINGRPSEQAPHPRVGVAVTSDPAAARIRIPGASTTSRIRVGQRLDTRSGKIQEIYSHTEPVPDPPSAIQPGKALSLDGTLSHSPATGRTDQERGESTVGR
jgi:hypothetical protein